MQFAAWRLPLAKATASRTISLAWRLSDLKYCGLNLPSPYQLRSMRMRRVTWPVINIHILDLHLHLHLHLLYNFYAAPEICGPYVALAIVRCLRFNHPSLCGVHQICFLKCYLCSMFVANLRKKLCLGCFIYQTWHTLQLSAFCAQSCDSRCLIL